MRLTPEQAWERFAGHDHAVLCTLHPVRGVDAVPVAFAVDDDGFVGVPVDTVKAKASGRLQRERNLEADPRATLLAEHWDGADWTRLWWVRATVRYIPEPGAAREEALAALLAARYPQYRDRPFTRMIVLRVDEVSGWAAG